MRLVGRCWELDKFVVDFMECFGGPKVTNMQFKENSCPLLHLLLAFKFWQDFLCLLDMDSIRSAPAFCE